MAEVRKGTTLTFFSRGLWHDAHVERLTLTGAIIRSDSSRCPGSFFVQRSRVRNGAIVNYGGVLFHFNTHVKEGRPVPHD